MKRIVLIALGLSFFCLTGFCLNRGHQRTHDVGKSDNIETIVNDNVWNRTFEPPRIEILAKMMLDEKKSGKMDDTPYISYLVDTLGFTKDRVHGKDEFSRNGMTVWLRKNTEETMSRSIRIQCEDSSEIWRMVVNLKQFGLQVTESDGAFGDMKGKGLYAGYGPNSISFGCVWN